MSSALSGVLAGAVASRAGLPSSAGLAGITRMLLAVDGSTNMLPSCWNIRNELVGTWQQEVQAKCAQVATGNRRGFAHLLRLARELLPPPTPEVLQA